MTDNILLIIVGLAAASCLLGAAAYLFSLSNEINSSKTENTTVVEHLDPVE